MKSKTTKSFQRPQLAVLTARLAEPRHFIQVVAGPRQVGKSTLVQQATQGLSVPVRHASADEPTLRDTQWLAQQWEAARLSMQDEQGAVLVLDEIQKIPTWSETVKCLGDEDTRSGRILKVVLLGSGPLLIAQGLTESLAVAGKTVSHDHSKVPRPTAVKRSAIGPIQARFQHTRWPCPIKRGRHSLVQFMQSIVILQKY